MIFLVLFMINARCKSVFVFSDLIMAENGKVVKEIGRASCRERVSSPV